MGKLWLLTSSEFVSPACDPKGELSQPLYEQQVNHGHYSQELSPGAVDDHHPNPRLFSTPILRDHRCSLGLDVRVTELLRGAESMQKPASDSERMDEGNLEDEKEWLGQVEEAEASRRTAVPLWQEDWDRGRRMLLPLVPCLTAGCATSEHTVINSRSQCPALNMEEETELAMACRTLDLYADKLDCTEAEMASFALDQEEDPTKGLFFSKTEFSVDHFRIPGQEGHALLPAKARAATDANNNLTALLEGDLEGCWVTDGSKDTIEDSLCSIGDAQCAMDTGFTEDIPGFISPRTSQGTHFHAQGDLFYSNTRQSTELALTDNVENVFRAAYCTETGSMAGMVDFHQNKEDEERGGSHCGAKMQDMYQDPCICPDLGDLPDDISEYMNDDILRTINPDVLFGDPWLSCVDVEVTTLSDIPVPAELPAGTGIRQKREKRKLTSTTNTRNKRPRVTPTQHCTDENIPSKPRRQRATGRTKTKEVQAEPTVTQGADTGSEPSSAEMAGLPTTPPRILHLHPAIQFITLPDTPHYQVIQTLRLIQPNTAATPTYIIVPSTSPPCNRHVPPLSPADGAVAPVQISSSPRGTLSDTASKAMTPPCASTISPINEMPTCKESPRPQSPAVLDIPQVVKDYIQKAKARTSQTCQYMEAGLCLTSHYVDVQVSQREVLRSGKTANKFLDKELVAMGPTDRQKSLLRHSQIFDGSSGDTPKRYILLLGNAGMGKTTLIRKLCLDWSRDCIPQFDFVFFLDGKNLTLTEPHLSLQTILLNLSSFAPPCMDPEAVYAQILAAPKRVLIIFDGFDELRDYESLLQAQEKDLITSLQKDRKAPNYTVRQLYSAILQRTLLPGCTLLLSTRPRGTACQMLRRADSLLEVCGFTPTDVEAYLTQYFADPALGASVLDYLKNGTYLHLLCWNPGLCRLVCSVLEQSKSSEVLPRTLTGLCHRVLCLKMDEDRRNTHTQAEAQVQITVQSAEETQTPISKSSQVKSCQKNTRKSERVRTRSCTLRSRRAKSQEEEEVDEEETSVSEEEDRSEERELLSQLSSLAWEGVKANSSTLPTGQTIGDKLKAFGLRTGLVLSHHLRTRLTVSSRAQREQMGSGGRDTENSPSGDVLTLLWANPFLQSFLAGVHLSMSRTVSDRTFLQTLPFHSAQKGRRRPQREELELTQRFAFGLLFYNRTELRRLHTGCTDTAFRDMVVGKQALVTKHLEGLSYGDLSPAQVLEACQYGYEASSTQGDGSRDRGGARLVAHLAANLPEILTFHGVPLNPSDVFAVQKVLERAGTEGRRFCLDLEDSGIQISGLRALVGLNNINTYRACIADVITLWEQLEQGGEDGLFQGAVSKLKIHPLKATQVCHIEHLAKLVNIHVHKRLSDSSSQSDSIFAEGVPAVKELHKLEFELGPEKGPLALTKLWELLPGLHNLQHLDLENSKIGDKGAEKLSDALASLCFLEVLNLSQNCIGDQGVMKLAIRLMYLPKLHCLSLYSNVISDEGAESLAAVLPHVASLTDLDVKYNKLTDVGAQSLGASLRNCKKIKSLRMWNQCIPYGVLERLQQQDSRILWQ